MKETLIYSNNDNNNNNNNDNNNNNNNINNNFIQLLKKYVYNFQKYSKKELSAI